MGKYTFIISNATGCTAQQNYNLGSAFAPKLVSYTVTGSDCSGTGSFKATFDIKATDPPYSYLLNTNGATFKAGVIFYNPAVDSTRLNITQLPAGTYTLTTIGPLSCSIDLLTFTIVSAPFLIDTSQVVIKSDVCGQDLGTIVGLQLTGAPAPTANKLKGPNRDSRVGYFWTDENGRRIGQQLLLAGMPSGTYHMYVVNDDLCKSNTVSFFIPDSISSASKPIVSDIKICLPGTVGLDVQNKDPDAHYQLYDSTKTLIDTSKAGYFSRKVANTTIFYIASKKGICPSPLAKVTVTVEDPGVNVPNAFTPNNDGINDYWAVTGLENYPGTEVSVFNRYGQRVYYSVNYNKPFDGRYNGADLPIGVYYYIIDTKKPDCRGGITGSLTIIR